MNKETKNLKERAKDVEQIKTAYGKSLEPIFKAVENAEQVIYTDHLGREIKECPGAYSVEMSIAMKHDIKTCSLMLYKDDPDVSNLLSKVGNEIEERDLLIRRMFDDRKDHRSVTDFPFASTESIINDFKAIKSNETFKNKRYYKQYKEKLTAWVKRFLQMDIWAFSLKSYDAIEKAKEQAEFRVFNEEGDIECGIPEKDEECVKTLLDMEKILIKALVKIPAHWDESQMCLKKLEVLDILIQAILTGNDKKLSYLIKCAEAAEEFRN